MSNLNNYGVPVPPQLGGVTPDVTPPNVSGEQTPAFPKSSTPLPTTPEELVEELTTPNEPVIVTTSEGDHGLDKCPKCGSSEIFYDIDGEHLKCNFCRYSWNKELAEEKYGLNGDIRNLRGTKVGAGADVIKDDQNTITIQCQGCAAEVVIQTETSLSARCHWCRQTLSVNSQVPNGAVPDMVLPFKLNKAQAVAKISEFAGNRKAFALKKFKDEFVPENVVGVYMPYMVIDANVTSEFTGEAEILKREYTVRVGNGDNARNEKRYDADVYKVARRFDAHIDDLITESNSARRDFSGVVNTNNVINAILPFDIKNGVSYSSKYLTGFTSEKRDMDVNSMGSEVHKQLLSIGRQRATVLSPAYDRGIRWETEAIDIHGSQWVAVYVPVWLYSYYVPKSSKPGDGVMHYIAVNGRNGNTMGSVPISWGKLWAATIATFVATASVCFPLGGLMLIT